MTQVDYFAVSSKYKSFKINLKARLNYGPQASWPALETAGLTFKDLKTAGLRARNK